MRRVASSRYKGTVILMSALFGSSACARALDLTTAGIDGDPNSGGGGANGSAASGSQGGDATATGVPPSPGNVGGTGASEEPAPDGGISAGGTGGADTNAAGGQGGGGTGGISSGDSGSGGASAGSSSSGGTTGLGDGNGGMSSGGMGAAGTSNGGTATGGMSSGGTAAGGEDAGGSDTGGNGSGAGGVGVDCSNVACGDCSFTIDNVILGSTDTVAYATVSWDADAFLVSFYVADATPTADSELFWEDDSVEVYLDLDNAKGTSFDANDFQIQVQLNNTLAAGLGTATWNAIGVVQSLDDCGYSVDVTIPWSAVGAGGAPPLGQTIGFDLGINDDTASGTREAQLMLYGGDQNFANPSLWGTLTLAE